MRYIFIALLTIIVPFYGWSVGKKVNKIVVDAGHGGKDFGAGGSFSYEKDITLAVSLKLGQLINDSLKNVDVIYTRTTDTYPTLVERHDIANKAQGDLFIAIHVNSTPYTYTKTVVGYKTGKKGKKLPIYKTERHHKTTRAGVESYVLGLHRMDQLSSEVKDEFTQEGNTNPEALLNESDPQTAIIVAQYTQAFLSRSIKLASKIQDQFAAQGRPDHGVKQMGLEVLAGSAMPGVLVEIGFITNEQEEAYLNSEKGQKEVALAIFKGIKAYKQELEK